MWISPAYSQKDTKTPRKMQKKQQPENQKNTTHQKGGGFGAPRRLRHCKRTDQGKETVTQDWWKTMEVI